MILFTMINHWHFYSTDNDIEFFTIKWGRKYIGFTFLNFEFLWEKIND